MKKVDNFVVGDVVYCALHGMGIVLAVYDDDHVYPVTVEFRQAVKGRRVNLHYTRDGKIYVGSARTLFFTPASINEGSTSKPFVPELVGKTFYFRFNNLTCYIAEVKKETEQTLVIRRAVNGLSVSIEIHKSRILSMRELGKEIKP